LHGPHTTPIEIIVEILEVREGKILPDHHLVEWFAEMQFKKFVVEERFADYPADELEKVEMVWVDMALLVRVEGDTVGCRREQRVIRVE